MCIMYTEKINSLVTMLWQSERECIEYKRQLEEQSTTIKELQADLYFAELELRDMQQIVDISHDIKYLQKLQSEIDRLTRQNKRLQAIQTAFKV